jgi:hypothetical protein
MSRHVRAMTALLPKKAGCDILSDADPLVLKLINKPLSREEVFLSDALVGESPGVLKIVHRAPRELLQPCV